MTNSEFITTIAPIIVKYQKSRGYKVASPIIAQAILESGWGKSKLAALYHNYFGMKCGSKWTGPSVNMTTQEEYTAGTLTTIKDNFRVYGSMEEGVAGYFDFIGSLSRYDNLKTATTPREYIERLKADGYATSSSYVENLMKLVTQYSLEKYDTEEKTMAKTRSAVVALAQSWVGKNESDGSYKEIIDIYNSYDGAFPRGTKMDYGWAWCACTWSALAIKLGYTDIMPIEISCGYLIEAAKSIGVWVENDGYTPQPGDAVLYDWDDSGSGDCTGWPDHVGTVEKVSGGKITVIEGNYSNAVKRRTISVDGRYIRGFIVPRYDAEESSATPSATKSVAEIAKEVIAGKWGNGDERKSALEAAGYDYAAVQKKVNELLSGSGTATKSVAEIAKEVIAGKWGNGDERKKKLTAAGYDYAAVQKKVNELLK